MSGDQIERDEQELIRLTNELLRSAVDDDAAPLERLLDDNYVSIDFGNKSKDKAALTKLWTTKNPKETAKSTITADDFQFHFYGDTAIVAYKITDVFRGNKGEQTFHDYSFDVWKKSGEGWRLVSSSTAALLPGRKVIALDAKTLDAYAGVYRSPEGDTFSITRKGDKLLVSISDGTKFDLVPQTEIEFYSPSNSIVSMFFVRDEQGRVAYAITRFYGTDTTLKKIK
jgi:ketosteroid isomerase-like protein